MGEALRQQNLSNTASATGGAGGNGGLSAPRSFGGYYGANAQGGTGGAASAIVSFSSSDSGSTYGYAKAQGGAGGQGIGGGERGSGGGFGGAGAATSSVTGGGDVLAKAYARGGDAGVGGNGAGGAATGSATAISTTTGVNNARATVTVVGGDGTFGNYAHYNRYGYSGPYNGLVGGSGGNVTGAHSTAIERDATGGLATAITRATGGNGAGGRVGGSGGQATGSTASATGFSAKAIVYQTGGAGGGGAYFFNAGYGGGSSLANAVSASAHGGYAYLKQVAIGGAGGSSTNLGAAEPGQVGTATSTLGLTDSAASSLKAIVGAYGGDSGLPVDGVTQSGFFRSWGGGDATANLQITSLHKAVGEATAVGGAGAIDSLAGKSGYAKATTTVTATGLGVADTATALAQALRTAGDYANAKHDAIASAVTAAGQLAQATAESCGLLFSTSANAATGGASVGLVTAVATSAQASGAGDSGTIAESFASVGGDDVASLHNQTAANAYAMATASPSANFTAPVLTDTKLRTSINTVLAGAEMGGSAYSSGGAGTKVFDSSATFTLNGAGLTGDLILGLMAPDVAGAGFSNLAFTVTVNGAETVDQTFTSLAAAQAYFTNDAVDLGDFAGQSTLKVVVSLDVTTAASGETFDSNFVLGQANALSASVTLTSGGPVTLAADVGQALLLPGSGVPYSVTANDVPTLVITDRAGTADLITLGAAGQSVLTYGAGSSDHVVASTVGEAGDLVRNLNHAADLLEITTGGSFTLNPGDFNVLVKLDQPSTLSLAGQNVGVEGTSGGDVIIVGGGQLWSTSSIDLGGSDNALTLQGNGTFDLRAPGTLTGVETLNAQEGQGGGAQTVYLRDGLDLIVNVASYGGRIIIHGAANADLINLGSGADTVFLGGDAETVVGGGGNDTFYASAATVGAHIDGGAGVSALDLTGGGAAAMGASISDIAQVNLLAAPQGQSQPAWALTANAIVGLKIFDFSKTADTITFGAAGQSATNIGGGADTFRFTAPGIGIDQITNFHSGLDHIGLDAAGFGLTTLSDLTFDIGPSPGAMADGRPNILYDTKTGALFFDAVGGDGHIVQIASLLGHPSLLASDFTLA